MRIQPSMLARTRAGSRDSEGLSGARRRSWRGCCFPPWSRTTDVQHRRQSAGSLGLAAAAVDRRRAQGADRLVARLPARSASDPTGGRAADAEVQHVVGRGADAGQLLRRRGWRDVSLRVRSAHAERAIWQTVEEQHPNRLGDALKIVTDNNYCVQVPPGRRLSAPAAIPRRLRRSWTAFTSGCGPTSSSGWVANPKRILPYTGMPVNIPHNMPVDQKLLPGTSEQQLNGVVDLLMNFDRFTKGEFSVKPLIKPAAPTPTAPARSAPAGAQRSNSASAVPQKSSQ